MRTANYLLLYIIGLLGATTLTATPANAEPDFSGVWRLEKDMATIRTLDGAVPPLTAWGRKEYESNQAAFARKDYSRDLTRLRCASPGAVRLMTLPYPIEFFQRPHQLTLLFEWNHHYRLVNLGPPKTAPYEIAIGISNGHWEGDTLVVRTTDLTDNTLLDSSGLPHGDKTVVTERIRLLRPDQLEDLVTISDPKAYEKDWSFRLTYRKTGATGIREDVCLDRMAEGRPAIETTR